MPRVRKYGRDVDGIFLLDKPEGVSSNKVMQQVKQLFQANKAGHTGALDPLATGMLPICLGEATKFSQFLLDSDKRYRVTAKLGERTNTSDAEGALISMRPVAVTIAEITEVLTYFCGNILQTPTMFSALKHNGKPLYEYARAGITLEREARPITIFEISLIEYQCPFLTLDIHCSKGTYIRTIIDDLGEKLGCGAHVTMLRRLNVANYDSTKMMTLEQLLKLATNEPLDELNQYLLPVDSAVSCLPKLVLNDKQTQAVGFGQTIAFDNQTQILGMVRLFSATQKFLGIGEIIEGNFIHPNRMLKSNLIK